MSGLTVTVPRGSLVTGDETSCTINLLSGLVIVPTFSPGTLTGLMALGGNCCQLASGQILRTSQTGGSGFNVQFLDYTFNEVTNFLQGTSAPCCAGGTNFFILDGNTIKKYSPVGVLLDTITLTGTFYTNCTNIGVSQDETWAIIGNQNDPFAHLYKVDLATGASAVFATEGPTLDIGTCPSSIIVLQDDTVVVGFFATQTDGPVKQYDSSGTVLHTTHMAPNFGGTAGFITAMCPGLDASKFYVGYSERTGTTPSLHGQVSFYEVTGAGGGTATFLFSKPWPSSENYDNSAMFILQKIIGTVATCLRAGTIIFGGYGDSGTCKFVNPSTGAILGIPANNGPLPGGGLNYLQTSIPDGHLGQTGGFPPGGIMPDGAGTWDASTLGFKAAFAESDGWNLAVDGSGYFYIMKSSASSPPDVTVDTEIHIYKMDANGSVIDDWRVTTPQHVMTRNYLAVNQAGTIAYCLLQKPSDNRWEVHVIDITGSGSYVGLLTTDFGSLNSSPMICPHDGTDDVIVGWGSYNDLSLQPNGGALIRYTSTGTIVRTYRTGGRPIYLANGLDPSATFWSNAYNSAVSTSSGSRLTQFNLATGAVIGSEFDLQDGDFEFDSQIAIMRVSVGTCTAVAPTTPAPVIVASTPCCGGTADTGSGGTQAGPVLPAVGPGWTPSFTGGGTVPSAPDVELQERWDY